jgi:hypothetical protein
MFDLFNKKANRIWFACLVFTNQINQIFDSCLFVAECDAYIAGDYLNLRAS